MLVPLPTRRATTRLAQALADALEEGDLVVLAGGLGAGKTFLVRALLRALGLPTAVAVPSPTFTLMNEYPRTLGVRVPVLHADLYRVLSDRSDETVADLGLRPRRADGWAVLVEWGAAHVSALGGEGLLVTIETSPSRVAGLEPFGARGEKLLDAVSRALSEPVKNHEAH